MSQTSVQAVHRFLTSGPGDLKDVLHPDVVFSEAVGLPYSGEWIGVDGVGLLLSQVFAGLKMAVLSRELVEIGSGRVLALMTVRFTSRRSGAALETKVMEIYGVRDGLVATADIYYKDPAGVAALLEPSPA